ncbi:MAG: MBL fold metallo-hydrolase [Thermodesulfobacteriota bacterium]
MFLSRRSFLKKGWVWFGRILIMGLFGFFLPRKRAGAERTLREAPAGLDGLTLKMWCDKKMHHRDGYFLNPFTSMEHKNVWRLLRWKLASENTFKPYYPEEAVTPTEMNWDPVIAHQGVAVTFINHACVMIKDVDRYILVDPVLSGLFWFKDFSPLTGGTGCRMPDPDHILITHGHYDHLDVRTLKRFKKTTHVISPPGYRRIFSRLAMNRHTELDWFESWNDGRREIVFLPCNHWTMRNPLTGPNDALWGSYLIKGAGGITIFISGDLAWFDHFAEIRQVGDIDLAIFNLGAYEPRWFMKESHINPVETVRAFRELRARHLMVVHWGTFRLGDEPVHFPPRDIFSEMEKQGLSDRLMRLNHGQTLFYGNNIRIP